jgi:hypothetical protein
VPDHGHLTPPATLPLGCPRLYELGKTGAGDAVRAADEIVGRLAELSQIDLVKVEGYERKRGGRTTILSRIDSLRGDEPWLGYDELTIDHVRTVLAEADDERAKHVRAYSAHTSTAPACSAPPTIPVSASLRRRGRR